LCCSEEARERKNRQNQRMEEVPSQSKKRGTSSGGRRHRGDTRDGDPGPFLRKIVRNLPSVSQQNLWAEKV
jgi:hypothetical protein